jgi:hypothetical protein
MDEPEYNKANWVLISATFGSVLAIAVTTGKTDETSVNGFRFAYIALFCIMLSKAILSCSRIKIDSNDSSKFSKIFQIIFPFLPILSIIFFIMIILFRYYDRITEGKVSDYYTSFMNLTSLLMIIQFYVIFKEITATNLYLSKKIASMLRLLGILATLSVITVYIVLKFYVTDC